MSDYLPKNKPEKMSDYYLPPEVLTDILLRLPVKTLLRFRTVCKDWYALITNPNFISQHLDNTLATPPPYALLRYCTQDSNHPSSHLLEHYSVRFDHDNNSFDEYTEPSFPFKSSGSCFRVVGSCNGLVCLFLFDGVSKDGSDQLLIWNPLIGKSVVVLVPSVSFRAGPWRYLGLGYDELRNDYKVVGIVWLEIQGQPSVWVYSLNPGIWREISTEGIPIGPPFDEPVAYLNGVAHWYVCDRSKQLEDTERSWITTFRFEDEEFGKLMLPEFGVACGTIMRLQDSLSLIDIAPYPEDSNEFIWWVWVMKEYGVGESWTLLYRVDTVHVLHGLVGFRMNGDLVMVTDNGSLITYDPESKQVKDLGIHGFEEQEELHIDSVYMGRYVESLVLLDRTPVLT